MHRIRTRQLSRLFYLCFHIHSACAATRFNKSSSFFRGCQSLPDVCMRLTSAVFYRLHWDDEPLKLNWDDKVRTANTSKENNVVVAPHKLAVSLPDPALQF